ncbi:MAG: GNAT family N-acetyltransferase [Clostridia bacterium]|nr:GNAT family N-acetyltransferase [Clostridia bacterium]
MDIIVMQKDHPMWRKTAAFARECSWRAGPYLAERMEKGAFTERERVIACVDGDRVVGFCTFSLKDSLPEDDPRTPFIGFMFVDEAYRGRRLSQRMIARACGHAAKVGYAAVYIVSGEKGLYEKYGFLNVGDVKTVHGTEEQLFRCEI